MSAVRVGERDVHLGAGDDEDTAADQLVAEPCGARTVGASQIALAADGAGRVHEDGLGDGTLAEGLQRNTAGGGYRLHA